MHINGCVKACILFIKVKCRNNIYFHIAFFIGVRKLQFTIIIIRTNDIAVLYFISTVACAE